MRNTFGHGRSDKTVAPGVVISTQRGPKKRTYGELVKVTSWAPGFVIIEGLFGAADKDKLQEDHEKGRASTVEKAVERFAKHARARGGMMIKAAESMPKRLKECLENGGGPTQY